MKSFFIVSTVFSALVGLAAVGCNPALESDETDEADHLQIETSSSAWERSPPLPPNPAQPIAGFIGAGGVLCDGDGLIGHEGTVSCPDSWACKTAFGTERSSCVPREACVANVNGRTTEVACPECPAPLVVRHGTLCVHRHRFDSHFGIWYRVRECYDTHECWVPDVFPTESMETE